ncbi:MAG TPA: hypothetical protein VFN30_08845 [Chitinophagaceae bacterium]|nr:hypothetical protein [Chitinophagaceae bacterium]
MVQHVVIIVLFLVFVVAIQWIMKKKNTGTIEKSVSEKAAMKEAV